MGDNTWLVLDHHDGICSEWTTPTLPSTPYGRAKVAAYQDLVGDPRACQLVWARLFFPFGSGEASDRLIPFVVNALLDGQPPVVRTGHLVRDFLHAAEVARAFVDLLESDVSGAVNVASGTGITITALVKELAALVGRPELVELGAELASKGGPPRLVADVTRLREDVGYRPRSDLRAGLAHVVSELRVERSL
jgi:nucleoside-diphosphate-sugar epimerase